MNRRLLGLVGIGAFCLLGIYIWISFLQSDNGTLILDIVPKDAKIVVGGKEYEQPKIELKPGTHRVAISRPGFATQAFNVTIIEDKTITKLVSLKVTSDIGRQYFKDHPDEISRAEGISGQDVADEAQTIQEENPILNLLPELRREWRIDYGKSQRNPNDPHAIALYITAIDESARRSALAWIKSKGYDPAKFEIIYRNP